MPYTRVGCWLAMAVSLAGCAAAAHAPPEPTGQSPRLAAAAAGEWEEWYFPADDGCTLYVLEMGSGTPLVILHGGWGAEHGYLLDAFHGLESRYRLIFFDQRGSLRSPCPDSLVSVRRHVSDLDGLRAELGLERALIAAHSMGTFLAMSYLQDHPDRVEGLVLLGSLLPSTPRDEEEARLFRQQEQDFVSFARAAEADQVAREGLEGDDLTAKEWTYRWRIGFASGNLYHVDRWRQLMGGRVFYDADAGRAAGRTMPGEWNFLPALAALPGPVTVINGDHDLVGFGGELHRRMLRDAPNVELVLIPRAGHVAWVDQPVRFRAELVEALRKFED